MTAPSGTPPAIKWTNGPRRTVYAVAIEDRARGIQEALGLYNYDACLGRIAHIRKFADILEREITAEREANPHWVAAWDLHKRGSTDA